MINSEESMNHIWYQGHNWRAFPNLWSAEDTCLLRIKHRAELEYTETEIQKRPVLKYRRKFLSWRKIPRKSQKSNPVTTEPSCTNPDIILNENADQLLNSLKQAAI